MISELSLAALGAGWAGVLILVRGAENANPADIARIIDYLTLVARDPMMPPWIPLILTTPDGAPQIAEIMVAPALLFRVPQADEPRVMNWWGCSRELAESTVRLTGGRAELIVELRSAIESVRQDKRVQLPTQAPVWFLVRLQEEIDRAVSSQIPPVEARAQAEHSRAVRSALESLAQVGGTAPLDLLDGFVPDSLIRPGGGWHLFHDRGDGLVTLHPLVMLALLGFPDRHEVEYRGPLSGANDLRDAWVRTALNDPRLLSVHAEQNLSLAGRQDLSHSLTVARESYMRNIWQDAAERLIDDLALPENGNINFQKVAGLQLSRLSRACGEQLRFRAINVVVSVLRHVARSDRSVTPALVDALLQIDVQRFDGSLSRETADLLVATELPDLRRDAMRMGTACQSIIGAHVAAKCSVYAAGLALACGPGFTTWAASSVADLIAGPLVSLAETDICALELRERGHEIYHALACTEESDAASSSEQLTLWVQWRLNASAPEVAEATRALVRGWDYEHAAYKAASVYVVSSLMEAYQSDELDTKNWREDRESLVVFAIALAERAAPREEPAWWAHLSELVTDPARRSQSELFYGMACATAHRLGGHEVPAVLRPLLTREPVAKPVWIDFPDAPHTPMTTAHRDWLLKVTRHVTVKDVLVRMRDSLIEPNRAIGALGAPCEAHSPLQAVEDLRTWLADVERLLGLNPYDRGEADNLIYELSGNA